MQFYDLLTSELIFYIKENFEPIKLYEYVSTKTLFT